MNMVGIVALLALAVSIAAQATQQTPPNASTPFTTGRALYYDQGQFERVLRVRERQGLITRIPEGITGYASRPPCSGIGSVVEASFLNPHTLSYGPTERLLQVDCAEPRDLQMQLRENRIEVDYQTALRSGFATNGSTTARVYQR